MRVVRCNAAPRTIESADFTVFALAPGTDPDITGLARDPTYSNAVRAARTAFFKDAAAAAASKQGRRPN